MNDPRHAGRTSTSGPPAPPAAVPILVWLGTSMAMLIVAWSMLSAVGLTYDSAVLRRGQATITQCSANPLSLGTTQLCRAQVEWEPKDQWRTGNVVLAGGESYTVESAEVLSGTVEVEGHARTERNQRRHEVVVPAGQTPSGPTALWFVVGLGVPVLVSVALLRLVILPWIARRTRAAGRGGPLPA